MAQQAGGSSKQQQAFLSLLSSRLQTLGVVLPIPKVGLLIIYTQNYAILVSRLIYATHPGSSQLQKAPPMSTQGFGGTSNYKLLTHGFLIFTLIFR